MTAPELEETEAPTRVLGCPDCRWSWEVLAGIDVEHLCGEGEVLFCDVCGWTYEVRDETKPGFAHAMAEIHLTRVGH